MENYFQEASGPVLYINKVNPRASFCCCCFFVIFVISGRIRFYCARLYYFKAHLPANGIENSRAGPGHSPREPGDVVFPLSRKRARHLIHFRAIDSAAYD